MVASEDLVLLRFTPQCSSEINVTLTLTLALTLALTLTLIRIGAYNEGKPFFWSVTKNIWEPLLYKDRDDVLIS